MSQPMEDKSSASEKCANQEKSRAQSEKTRKPIENKNLASKKCANQWKTRAKPVKNGPTNGRQELSQRDIC
jgi:hypothetical protein